MCKRVPFESGSELFGGTIEPLPTTTADNQHDFVRAWTHSEARAQPAPPHAPDLQRTPCVAAFFDFIVAEHEARSTKH